LRDVINSNLPGFFELTARTETLSFLARTNSGLL
jgi:hypothetical protein